MKIYKNLTFILLVLVLISCNSMKPQASKEGVKLYETFFVGEEGTQYFIKPLKFKNDSESLLIDYTFRYHRKIQDSKPVEIKVSLLSTDFIKNIKSLTISNKLGTSIVIKSADIELLFNEPYKKGYKSRFKAKCNLLELKELYSNNSWEITIDQRNTFSSTSNTKKKVAKLSKAIFVLF